MKRERVPGTTTPWPESRGESRRHQRLHLVAQAQRSRIGNAIEAEPKIGSKIAVPKAGDLARAVRGLRRKTG